MLSRGQKSIFAIISIILLSVSSTAVIGASTTLYHSDFSSLEIDGTIADREYPTTFNVPHWNSGTAFLTVSWGHNNSHVAIGITGDFTGYVGFGMNEPGKGMTGADMIIASVVGGVLDVFDYYSTGNVAPTKDDNQRTIVGAGKEVNGKTSIEFVFPMKSDDTEGQDVTWEVGGEYGFFFAAHETSDALGYHTWHSKSDLTVSIADSSKTPSQSKVTLGEAEGNATNSSVFAPILFWSFLTFIAIAVWQNSKFY